MEKKCVKCPACGHVQEVELAPGQMSMKCQHEKCQKLVRPVAHEGEAPQPKPKKEAKAKEEKKK